MILDLSRFSQPELLLELCLYAVKHINSVNATVHAVEMQDLQAEIEFIRCNAGTGRVRASSDDLGFMTRASARGHSLMGSLLAQKPHPVVINTENLRTTVVGAFKASEHLNFRSLTVDQHVIPLKISLRDLNTFDAAGFDELYGENAVLNVAMQLDCKRRPASEPLTPTITLTPTRTLNTTSTYSTSPSPLKTQTRRDRIYNTLTIFTGYIRKKESADLSTESALTTSPTSLNLSM